MSQIKIEWPIICPCKRRFQRSWWIVGKCKRHKTRDLEDSNAAAHFVDSHIFYAMVLLPAHSKAYINLYFFKWCQFMGNLSLYASTSCMMTHWWQDVMRDCDRKST